MAKKLKHDVTIFYVPWFKKTKRAFTARGLYWTSLIWLVFWMVLTTLVDPPTKPLIASEVLIYSMQLLGTLTYALANVLLFKRASFVQKIAGFVIITIASFALINILTLIFYLLVWGGQIS